MADNSFKAFRVSETSENKFESNILSRSIEDLPDSDVLIKVHYSSLNFKDALSASGNKGVTRKYPHTPGIDAAGVVVSSKTDDFAPGDEVIVTGYDLGMNTDGGFSQYVCVPRGWVLRRPGNLTLKDSMILGTAGLTAALCVQKLIDSGVVQGSGEILVTGSTGGVGVLGISLLVKLGFDVTASTGKSSEVSFLEKLGARVIAREELSEITKKPLLSERWAGAIDVVGGETLVNILKQIKYGGSVAACGLVGSSSFKSTVLPFILRGVNLLGVDSVELPLTFKEDIWEKFGGIWKLDNLAELSTEILLEDLPDNLGLILAGKAKGRILLNLKD